MTLINSTYDESTQSTYTTYGGITIKGSQYQVLVVTGKFNYVHVLKKTNIPFGSTGKQFKDFDEACLHYNSPEMKVALLKIETGLV